MSLTQYTYGAGNYAEFVSRCEKTGKGMIALSLTNYDNNNACEIAEGSVVEINGAIFRQESGNTTITGTPANNVVNYILMSSANNAATAAWTDSTPTWSDAYQGYYSGTSRYVGGCYYDGADYIRKWIYRNIDTGPKEEYLMVALVGECQDPALEATAGNRCIFYGGHATGDIWLPIYDLQNNDIITEMRVYSLTFAGTSIVAELRRSEKDTYIEPAMASVTVNATGVFTDTSITNPVIDMDNYKYFIDLYRTTSASPAHINSVRLKRIRMYR